MKSYCRIVSINTSKCRSVSDMSSYISSQVCFSTLVSRIIDNYCSWRLRKVLTLLNKQPYKFTVYEEVDFFATPISIYRRFCSKALDVNGMHWKIKEDISCYYNFLHLTSIFTWHKIYMDNNIYCWCTIYTTRSPEVFFCNSEAFALVSFGYFRKYGRHTPTANLQE